MKKLSILVATLLVLGACKKEEPEAPTPQPRELKTLQVSWTGSEVDQVWVTHYYDGAISWGGITTLVQPGFLVEVPVGFEATVRATSTCDGTSSGLVVATYVDGWPVTQASSYVNVDSPCPTDGVFSEEGVTFVVQ